MMLLDTFSTIYLKAENTTEKKYNDKEEVRQFSVTNHHPVIQGRKFCVFWVCCTLKYFFRKNAKENGFHGVTEIPKYSN